MQLWHAKCLGKNEEIFIVEIGWSVESVHSSRKKGPSCLFLLWENRNMQMFPNLVFRGLAARAEYNNLLTF